MFEAMAERHVQAVGEESDEDMRLDMVLMLMVDRPDGEIPLSILNASSTATNCK